MADDFPHTWDEYDNYAPAVAALVRDNAGTQAIADYLQTIARDRMGVSTSPEHRSHVGQLVRDWYPGSIAMWSEGRAGVVVGTFSGG